MLNTGKGKPQLNELQPEEDGHQRRRGLHMRGDEAREDGPDRDDADLRDDEHTTTSDDCLSFLAK